MIDRFDAVGAAISSLPLDQQRIAIQAELDEMFRANAASVAELANVDIADHRLAVAGGEISARVFTPRHAGTLPGLVHFHGGGFTLGTIDSFFSDVRLAHISAEAGCVVVTIGYRLAPEHRFPIPFEDCYSGLLWVAREAQQLGIDPARIAVAGESAGGNLAAAVALAARDRGGPPIVLQLLEVPVTDLTAAASSSRRSRSSARASDSTATFRTG